MKTFNKKGDQGETSLLFGQRVSKDDLHCEAYGTIDEAVSALGIARNLVTKDRTKEVILRIQKELFAMNAELAARSCDYDRFSSTFPPITSKMAQELEDIITSLEAQIQMPKAFIMPGASIGSAWLDLCRTIIRRAERRVVTLRAKEELKNETVLSYLNRLADLLFTLARYEES